ncbi:hypothetical protein [Streptomyces sp. NPDC000410]|uniref:hypothetical protein n=1 Tax=Streptomyces sp. NPDC000410 TaxID=3154254 RepID=UPI003328C688
MTCANAVVGPSKRKRSGGSLLLASDIKCLGILRQGASATRHTLRHMPPRSSVGTLSLAELEATKVILPRLAERAAATERADCTDSDVCRILTGANGLRGR